MHLDEFLLHLDRFNREFSIDISPDARANKLVKEVLEFVHAHDQETVDQADQEAIDVLVCAIANVYHRGIVNMLDACYFKLERTAVKYRARKLQNIIQERINHEHISQ